MEGEKEIGRSRRTRLSAWVAVMAALMGATAPALEGQAAPLEAARDTLDLAGSGPLGLADAVALALGTHPALEAASAGLAGAAAAEREARAARYPSLRLSGSAVRYEEPMMVAPLHAFDPQAAPAFDETLLQGEATAAYTLFDGGGRGARIDRARAERGAAAAEVERSRARLVAGVSAIYLRVLSSADILTAHDQRLEALAAEEARVRALLAEGTAPPVQLLRIQAALEAARADAVEARVGLRSTELELARVLSLPPSATRRERLAAVAPAEETSAPDRAAALLRAREANPDLAAAERSAAAAEAGAAVARSARWPTIDGFGSYWERGGGDADFQGEWAAGVKVAVPVFTGGALGGRIAQAEAGARAARARTRLAALEVAGEVDAALAALDEAASRAEALEAAVESQAAVVETERVALEVGAGVQTDYLNAEADLLAARASLTRARHAVLLARVELARVQGELDEAWITENLETR